jgi:hypothetical protein
MTDPGEPHCSPRTCVPHGPHRASRSLYTCVPCGPLRASCSLYISTTFLDLRELHCSRIYHTNALSGTLCKPDVSPCRFQPHINIVVGWDSLRDHITYHAVYGINRVSGQLRVVWLTCEQVGTVQYVDGSISVFLHHRKHNTIQSITPPTHLYPIAANCRATLQAMADDLRKELDETSRDLYDTIA